MDIKICYVAGISGGHIIPCLTLAQKIKKNNPNAKILFFTSTRPSDAALIQHNSIVDTHVMLPFAKKPTRYREYPAALIKGAISLAKSMINLIVFRPQEIITTGGIVAIPVCLIGRLLRIPVSVYELNAIPGKATTFIAPYAQKIQVCFNQTMQYFPKNKAVVVPYPLRQFPENSGQTAESARSALGLSKNKKTIVILGGSQGSRSINMCIKQWIEHNPQWHSSVQIIHQTGLHDTINWHHFYTKHHVQAYVFSFSHDIALCYQAADLIICRAGAGTIFEVKFFNKKCIVIPLETNSTSHQLDNAYAIAHAFPQLFTVLEQKEIELKPDLFAKTIEHYL